MKIKINCKATELNQNDGVIVCILEDVIEDTEILEIDRLKLLNTKIKMKNGSVTEISSSYHSHEIPKSEFINSIAKLLLANRSKKNHYAIGDFNIDLLRPDSSGEESLNNSLERGYLPGYQEITHPTTNSKDGTYIDNIFCRSESLTTKSYTVKNSITDHYILIFKIN